MDGKITSCQLTLTDGRIILIKELIFRLLQLTGHSVKESQSESYLQEVRFYGKRIFLRVVESTYQCMDDF